MKPVSTETVGRARPTSTLIRFTMALFPARTINMKSAGATRRVLSEMPRPTITPTITTTIVEPSWVTALRNAVEMLVACSAAHRATDRSIDASRGFVRRR